MSTPTVVQRGGAARGATALPGAARRQLGVAAGQGLAGVGNLLFALLLARVLPPAEFAAASAFLALYVLLHTPAASLSAGGAVAPGLVAAARGPLLAAGAGSGLVLVATAGPLAAALDLPVPLVWAFAVATPGALVLALERGGLYGRRRLHRVVGTLLAEPALRLTAGLALAAVAGAAGAAAAVVVGGYAALLLALDRRHAAPVAAAPRRLAALATLSRHAGGTMAVFALLAGLQHLDLLLANGLLDGDTAGAFAVLSTLGGAAAFATATVPLVLLPEARADHRAVRSAVAVAAGLGLAATAVVAAAPRALVTVAFGARYADVAPLAGRYVLAMALLGVGRVLAANRAATSRPRSTLAVCAAAVGVQVGGILAGGPGLATFANATLAGAGTLTAGVGALHLLEGARRGRPALRRPRLPRADRRTVLALAGLTVVALGLRLVVTRGLWLDEATSVAQARMSFSGMLADLGWADVHPPLHHVITWVSVRLLGDGPLAVRIPSILAGAAVVPAVAGLARDLYGRRAALIAAALCAVSPLLVWYSQEARMYALFTLLAVLAAWAQVRALRGGGAGAWAAVAVTGAALVWTHYYAGVLVAVQHVAVVVVAWRRRRDPDAGRLWRRWAAALAGTAVLVAPVVPLLADQLANYADRGVGLQEVPQAIGTTTEGGPFIYTIGANLAWLLFGYHTDAAMERLVALWPLGLLGALLLLGRRWSAGSKLLVALAGGPPLVLLTLVAVRPDLFELRYFIGATPLLLVLLARLLDVASPRRLGGAVVVLAAVGVLLGALVDQQGNRDVPRRYEFAPALAEVQERMTDGDQLVFAPSYLDDLVAYYAPGADAVELDQADVDDPDGRVFLLGSFLEQPRHGEPVAAAVEDLTATHGDPDVLEFTNVTVWIFP